MLHVHKLFASLLAVLPLVAGTASAQAPVVSLGAGPGWHRAGTQTHGVAIGHRGRAPRAYPARYPARRSPVWVPGHYERVERQVWVPGRERSEWVPPRFEVRIDACGRRVPLLVVGGHWRRVVEPGHYETCVEEVWVPGAWR